MKLGSGKIRSPYFHLKMATSHKHSPTGHTRGYMKLGSGKQSTDMSDIKEFLQWETDDAGNLKTENSVDKSEISSGRAFLKC